MKPEKCSLCKGNLKRDVTDIVVEVEGRIISIKEIPAYICDECGEAYFTPEISRKIDNIMKKFHEGKLSLHPIEAGELTLAEA
ncbi:type II toxin-antitoxin system MqsA family antitoxin [Candidatus Pyrohabitans sp.]